MKLIISTKMHNRNACKEFEMAIEVAVNSVFATTKCSGND